MPDSQVSVIKSYLKPEHIMLEYGAGGSTIYFSQFVKKYISIEHDKQWVSNLKNSKLLNNNTEIYYCPPNTQIKLPVWTGSEKDFYNYINYIDKIDNKKYDIVLIDGRARQFCAIKILNYIDENSIVFVHDFFERPRYHNILNYYNIIDQNISNKSISLVVFKKKINKTDNIF